MIYNSSPSTLAKNVMNRRFSIGDPIPSTIESRHTYRRANSRCWGDYSVVGASVRGKLHIRNEVPRDDAFVVRSNGAWLAVAVSDGVGSRPDSRYGASFAANRLCTRLFYSIARLESDGLEEVVRRGFRQTRVDLERFASDNEIQIGELHCTLLALLLNSEIGVVGMGQIGDGLILGLANNGEAIPLIDPPMPHDLSSTYVITQNNWEQYFYSSSLDNGCAQRFKTFFIMTDGVADDCQYGPPEDILQLWATDMDREIRLFPDPKGIVKRLKYYLATYKAKGSFDDRTLVVVYR